VYAADTLDERPIVSLCESKGVVIKSSTLLDLCITLTPVQANEKPKSFLCVDLSFKPQQIPNRYVIDESADMCMLKMRSYANSKGITIESPLDFTYDLQKDPTGIHDTVGTVAVHLKWAQEEVPINQLSNRDIGTTKSANEKILALSISMIFLVL
jgi:hypothetical protein